MKRIQRPAGKYDRDMVPLCLFLSFFRREVTLENILP
jgi:hypothetical protein